MLPNVLLTNSHEKDQKATLDSTMSTNFTVRRPTPASNDSSDVDSTPTFKVPALPQHVRNNHRASASSPLNPNGKRALAFGDSDDEEDAATEELVVSFDAMGAQRCVIATRLPQSVSSYHSPESFDAFHSAHGDVVKKEQLVIPSIPNKDWRAAARQRKGFKPDNSKIKVGADGSQGAMGTRDTINSGPQQSGLIVYKKRKIEGDAQDVDGDLKMEPKETEEDTSTAEDEAMTDEKRAVNALLAAAKQASEGTPVEEMTLEAIPMPESVDWRQTKSEAEAYREDVATRPDSATLNDYQRVPVSQFGTALLMGMGWKPGQGASKSGKGPIEAHAPKARPALLGLGAKPTDVVEDSKQKGGAKPSKKYIPVIAKEREGSTRNGDSSKSDSRRSERDGDSRGSKDRREYEKPRDRSRDRGNGRDRSRSRERRDHRDGDREKDRDRDYGRSGSHRRDNERRESGRDRARDDKHREDRRDDSRRR